MVMDVRTPTPATASANESAGGRPAKCKRQTKRTTARWLCLEYEVGRSLEVGDVVSRSGADTKPIYASCTGRCDRYFKVKVVLTYEPRTDRFDH